MIIFNLRSFIILSLIFVGQYSISQDFSTISKTGFTAVGSCAVDFADIDGDGDMDALITGRNAQEEITAFLYKNDGKGEFIMVEGAPFVGVAAGSIAFWMWTETMTKMCLFQVQ